MALKTGTPALSPRFASSSSLPDVLSAPWLGLSRSKVVFSLVLKGGWGELSKGAWLQVQMCPEEVSGLPGSSSQGCPALPKVQILQIQRL